MNRFSDLTEIEVLFDKWGTQFYSEHLSQTAHAVQCAVLAEESGAPSELVLAALLHDIGHYPFSHALEEIGVPHHEDVAAPLLCEGPIATILRESFAADAPERVLALVRGVSDSPLQGLISGSIDLDKTDFSLI